MSINYNGYYLSEAQPYEDWHGGLKVEHINFIAYCFNSNGRIFIAGKVNENNFTSDDFLVKKKPIFYIENENSIEVTHDKNSIFEIKSILIKSEDNQLIDSSNIKYKFVPWKVKDLENQIDETNKSPKTDL